MNTKQLKAKARERRTTRNPDNWARPKAFGLHDDDVERLERLCKHHGLNGSQLIRYLLLKEDTEVVERGN